MCIVIEPILATPGVLFFLTWSFFPKEGFGQGGFNEAPLFDNKKKGSLLYDSLCVLSLA